MFTGYWSNASMAFFVMLGLYTMWVVSVVKQNEKLTVNHNSFWNASVLSFVSFLTIIAAYRLVVHGIGGSDAISYKFFFEKCNDPHYASYDWFLHQDLLFRYCTKFLRLFTSDYHFYFIILYGFNVIAYILFLLEFCQKRSNYIPCILMIFLYWRSFNTLRSNTATAVMMIALIMLNRRRVKTAVCVALSTILIHKMSAVYFMFFPFYHIFTRYKLTKLRFVLVMALTVLSGSILQTFFLDFTEDMDLGGAYYSYANRSLNSSFLDNGWKIASEQMLLGICMWLNYHKIQKHIDVLPKKFARSLYIVWMLCLFDMMTIPINFTMGVWRGYTFFYLPRLVMWCEILYLFNKGQAKNLKPFLNVAFLSAFISWMIFRFYNMWEDSNLMPYIFEPFMNIL